MYCLCFARSGIRCVVVVAIVKIKQILHTVYYVLREISKYNIETKYI